MTSRSVNGESWLSAQTSLRKVRLHRWWNVKMWPHWIRHAWVTRKCPWDSNVQTSCLPQVDIAPAVQSDWDFSSFVADPSKIPTLNPGKYPTRLTDRELYLIKIPDSCRATELALDYLCKNR